MSSFNKLLYDIFRYLQCIAILHYDDKQTDRMFYSLFCKQQENSSTTVFPHIVSVETILF